MLNRCFMAASSWQGLGMGFRVSGLSQPDAPREDQACREGGGGTVDRPDDLVVVVIDDPPETARG